MKRKRAIVIAAAACALIAVAIAIAAFSGPREPEYGGRKLSKWMANGRLGYASGADGASVHAIRTIGTNALPFLLKWVGYEQPRWESWLAGKLRKIPLVGEKLSDCVDRPDYNAVNAARAFEYLGEDASGGVAELGRMLSETRNRYTRTRIRMAFLGLDRAGVSLTSAVPGILLSEQRMRAAGNFSRYDTDLRFYHTGGMSDALIRAFASTDASIKESATNAARLIAPEVLPEQVRAR